MVDAALGKSIELDTVYGKVKMDIPQGTQPNQILRIRGKGVKDVKNPSIVGDQLVHVTVKTPTKINNEQKKLLEEFQKLEEKKNKSIFDKIKDKLKN